MGCRKEILFSPSNLLCPQCKITLVLNSWATYKYSSFLNYCRFQFFQQETLLFKSTVHIFFNYSTFKTYVQTEDHLTFFFFYIYIHQVHFKYFIYELNLLVLWFLFLSSYNLIISSFLNLFCFINSNLVLKSAHHFVNAAYCNFTKSVLIFLSLWHQPPLC